ncbi:NAD(P)-binding protein [Martensiomyces pterosporus]|nr:NAD(P)-binding protein [Martensiomyces pterosporus]
MTETVAIIGATGAQGGSVLKALSAVPQQYKLRAITRNVGSDRARELQQTYKGVEWISADLNDIDGLRKAFKGVDVVFGTTNYLQKDIFDKIDAGDLDAEFKQGKNFVDAAIAEGVKHIVYSGLESPKEVSNGKYSTAYEPEGKTKIEQYIRANSDKVKGYFVYAGFYFQNFLYSASWETRTNAQGQEERVVVFTYPTPEDVVEPYLDIEEDFGNTVQLVLDNREEYEGKVVTAVEGDYTGVQIAEAFTRVTGVPAVFKNGALEEIDRKEIYEMLEFFVEFGAFSKHDTAHARNTTPRPFTTLDQFWKRYESFRPQ